jgi:hypothetical protein
MLAYRDGRKRQSEFLQAEVASPMRLSCGFFLLFGLGGRL